MAAFFGRDLMGKMSTTSSAVVGSPPPFFANLVFWPFWHVIDDVNPLPGIETIKSAVALAPAPAMYVCLDADA